MTRAPIPHVRQTAATLVEASATLIAKHSAHVPHSVGGQILYDLDNFLNDYAMDRRLRNDLSLLFIMTVNESNPVELKAIPLKLDFCHTHLADGTDAAWMRR